MSLEVVVVYLWARRQAITPELLISESVELTTGEREAWGEQQQQQQGVAVGEDLRRCGLNPNWEEKGQMV